MNNKHQELIDKKVVEFTKLFEGKNIFGSWMIINIFKMHIKDTIDTVLEKERERVLEALTVKDRSQMLEGWERYWIEVETDRFVENCIECDNTFRILKALDKTPPNTV